MYVDFNDLFTKDNWQEVIQKIEPVAQEPREFTRGPNSVLFEDVAGKLQEVRAESTRTFIKEWFSEGDKVTLALQDISKPAGENAFHHATFWSQTLSDITDEDIKGMQEQGGKRYVIFFTVNPVIEDATEFKRGGLANVKHIIGVYADLDVKPGCFRDRAHVLEFIASLPVQPSLVVGSGSGGVHAYWKFKEPVDPSQGWIQGAFTRWLQEFAGQVSIDGLKDTSRILKLAGGLKYKSGDDNPTEVELVSHGGPTHSFESIVALTADSRERLAHEEKREKRVMNKRVEKIEEYYSDKLGDSPIAKALAVATLEDRINAEVDWHDDIFIPAGWTQTATYPDGTEQYQRPGADSRASKRSATVKWSGSEGNAMSLLSEAPETLLTDIKAKGEPLTKMRVLLRVIYLDDYKAMVDDVLSGKYTK